MIADCCVSDYCLSWRKTSPQKHNDSFWISKIVIHCKNRIAFSLETPWLYQPC